MPEKNPSPAYKFALTALKKNPNVVFADMASAAQKKGIKIYPIVYGRACRTLGLTKQAKPPTAVKRRGRPAVIAKRAAPPPGRLPARPAARGLGADFSKLVGQLEQAIAMRGALQEIASIINRTLRA